MPERGVTPELVARWTMDLGRPPPHRWWIGMAGEGVAGFVGIGPSRDPIDPALGELDTIAVDPRWWRSGLGRALMTTALEYLSIDGYEAAVLWTLAGYERGQRFYEALGWTEDGGARDGGREIRYRVELAARPI
jgi:GNAT superfamily N-acetyltransferase